VAPLANRGGGRGYGGHGRGHRHYTTPSPIVGANFWYQARKEQGGNEGIGEDERGEGSTSNPTAKEMSSGGNSGQNDSLSKTNKVSEISGEMEESKREDFTLAFSAVGGGGRKKSMGSVIVGVVEEGNKSGQALNLGDNIKGMHYQGSSSRGEDTGNKVGGMLPSAASVLNARNYGETSNVYVGQWDSIKEKMVWGVMERGEVATAGILDPNNLSPTSLVGVESRSRGKQKPKVMHAKKGKKHIANSPATMPHLLSSCDRGVGKVGEKRKGGSEVDEGGQIGRGNQLSLHNVIDSPSNKRVKAVGQALLLRDEDEAEVVS
jgi:hypothetical protein